MAPTMDTKLRRVNCCTTRKYNNLKQYLGAYKWVSITTVRTISVGTGDSDTITTWHGRHIERAKQHVADASNTNYTRTRQHQKL